MEKKKDKAKYKTFASKMREDLYRNLKLLSAAEGKPVQSLLEEAVIEYLDGRLFTAEERRDSKFTQLLVRMPDSDYESRKKKPKK